MNEILGGAGTSRITTTVRSNEGLAYSAGSGLSFGVFFPGRFRAAFQSKSRSVPYATSLVMAEIRKIREGSVTAEELDPVLVVAGSNAAWLEARLQLASLTNYVERGGRLLLHRPDSAFLAAAQPWLLFPTWNMPRGILASPCAAT